MSCKVKLRRPSDAVERRQHLDRVEDVPIESWPMQVAGTFLRIVGGVNADLAADPHAVWLVPGVRGIGQHLAAQERFDAASSCSGICSVSRRPVSGPYSTTAGLASIVVSKRPRNGSATVPRLWIFLMTGGAVSLRVPCSLSSLTRRPCRRGRASFRFWVHLVHSSSIVRRSSHSFHDARRRSSRCSIAS